MWFRLENNNPPNPKNFGTLKTDEKNETALNNAGNGMESMGALSSHVCKRIIMSQKRLKLI